MATIMEIAASHQEQLTDFLQDLSIHDPSDSVKEDKIAVAYEAGEIMSIEPKVGSGLDSNGAKNDSSHHYGFCAICFNTIVLQETALVKGCEHAYCVTCILRWATYKKEPTCPQCKHPFEFLHIHRCLDGSIQDYMFEESVCLLLRAPWFKPLVVEEKEEEVYDEMGYFYSYEDDEEEDLDEVYFGSSSSIRIGNRRWGDNGFVRAGRQEARPVRPNVSHSGAGSSRQPKKEEAANGTESVSVGRRAKRAMKREAADKAKHQLHTEEAANGNESVSVGRRDKRAMKREAADKAAAAKHQQHLVRLGRV